MARRRLEQLRRSLDWAFIGAILALGLIVGLALLLYGQTL